MLSDDHKDFCQCLAAAIVDFLVSEEDTKPFIRQSSEPTQVFTNDYHTPVIMNNRSKELVSQVVAIVNTLGCGDLLVSVVSALCSKSGLYPVVETLGPAIVDISRNFKLESRPLQSLLDYCVYIFS